MAGTADETESQMLEQVRGNSLHFERMMGALLADPVGSSFGGADRRKVAAQLASFTAGPGVPSFGLSDRQRQRLAEAWQDGVRPRRTLLQTEIGPDSDVAARLPADLAPQQHENLTRLAGVLTSRQNDLGKQVLRILSAVAANPDRYADVSLEGLAEYFGVPPALLSDQGLQLRMPHPTDVPTPSTPPHAKMRIDLNLGPRLRVRISPEALGAEGDIADVDAGWPDLTEAPPIRPVY
jgi:hypothetical protein